MKKNKKYSFNTSTFKEFVDKNGTTPTTVSKAIGKANGYWGMNCYNGSSMDASTLCELCNVYGLSPLMFFTEEGTPMDEVYDGGQTKTCPGEKQNLSATEGAATNEEEHTEGCNQGIMQMQLKHREEMHRMEIKFMREQAESKEAVRKEIKAEFETERIRMEDRYEEKLSRKDERIAQLTNQLAELQAQYRELEIQQNNTRGFGYPIGASESVNDYQSK